MTVRGDYHTHHVRCGHAWGSVREYVEAALAGGFHEIGITDHAPLYWKEGDHPQPGSAMARSWLREYVAEVLALREEYRGRIRILLGLESDYAPGFDSVYREVFASYPFDYIIGSVHYSHGYHIYQRQRWEDDPDPEEVYAEYFRLIRESAASGLFDVLGHITGMMALGPHPSDSFLDAEFRRTAEAIASSGVAVEVNTSGLRKGTGAPFPHPDLLALCIDAGVALTYGSDCHNPSEVGHGWEVAEPILKGARIWRPEMRRMKAEG